MSQPIASSFPRLETASQDNVFNLAILVSQSAMGQTNARAANLPLECVEAATVREAMSMIVQAARVLIANHLEDDNSIPWIEPPTEAQDGESRFLVPLHL